jgi:protein ImuB
MKRFDSAKTKADNAAQALTPESLPSSHPNSEGLPADDSVQPTNFHEQAGQRPSAEILSVLHKWGIHTLGDLAALDKEELRARLGPEAVPLWEKANGISNRLLKFVQPPESFEESFEFEHEIETAEPLLFIIRRFLEQLSFRLSAIYLVAKELLFWITFSNDDRYERCFKIPQPTNDIDVLFRMLQTHLENFKSEHPIIAVGLRAAPVKPDSQQFGLFETALKNPQQLYQTLARLSALVGAERIGTPVVEETHRPDAFRMEPFAWKSMVSNIPLRKFQQSSLAGDALKTPPSNAGIALRRFRPNGSASMFISEKWPTSRAKVRRLDESAGRASSFYLTCCQPDVIPFKGAARQIWLDCQLQSEKLAGKVIARRGPYSLSGNWWDEKSWSRTEWDLELEKGELVRCHESNGMWQIDGIYD